MKNSFFKVILISLLVILFGEFRAQYSTSGQVNVITPSILSGCSSDTVFLEVTNSFGPSCNVASSTDSIEFVIELPDTVVLGYQSGSVGSLNVNASEISYAGGVLTLKVLVPPFGTTDKVFFVLNATCEISTLTPLPQLDITANYPVGFPTLTENWLSAKMNVGLGELTFSHGSATQASIVQGFAYQHNYAGYAYNTGFGSITEVTYHQIVHDSLYGRLNSTDHIYVRRRYPTAQPAVSKSASNFADYQITDLGNGYRYYSVTFKGNDLDPENGSLDPGEGLQINASYLNNPSTCIDEDMIQKQWVSYKCANGGNACAVPDTLYRSFKITAGTPIIGGTNGNIDVWDGAPNKNAVFSFANTGVGDPARPDEVSVSFDTKLSLTFGGLLEIDNLTINGTPFASSPFAAYCNISSFPAQTTTISFDFKDNATSDPDGSGTGIEDVDLDGYWDDIRPGETVDITFTYTVPEEATGNAVNYDIKAGGTFTDYCRKLNGSSAVSLYNFGIKQKIPTSQETPVADMGTLGLGDFATVSGKFEFNYEQININAPNEFLELRLNYDKTNEILEPIMFLGNSLTLADFTVEGIGASNPPAGTTAPSIAHKGLTDTDSVLVYTLTGADVALLFDGLLDSLEYSMGHISCDSFQTQTNSNFWELYYYFDASSQPIDIAKVGFGYQVAEGCGGKPNYVTSHSELYRSSAIGFTDETETTQAVSTVSGRTKFYEGDTMTIVQHINLNSDWPIMEDIGQGLLRGNRFYGFRYNMQIHYDWDPSVDVIGSTAIPFTFVEDLSYVKITDTVNGLVIANVPLKNKDFYNWPGGFSSISAANGPKVLGDNLIPYRTYPGGLGDYYCGVNSNNVDVTYCPYDAARYRQPNSNMYFMMLNKAKDRMSELRYISLENALIDAGINFSPGLAQYKWEIVTKWNVEEGFNHLGNRDFKITTDVVRTGNQNTYAPNGTQMGDVGAPLYIGTVLNKELTFNGGGANYESVCGLDITNALDFNNFSGDYIDGEVRIPYKMDSMTVDLPLEYYTTSTEPVLSGTNGSPANSIQYSGTSIGGGLSGHLLFTHNNANSGLTYADFPRFSDADGNGTVWSLDYSLSNTGTDNFITQTYQVPVAYFLRDEFDRVTVLRDTFTISESTPQITISALGGSVLVDNGGSCSTSSMDVLVANNTLYGASNVFVAVESSLNTTVLNIEDVDNTVSNPIMSDDTSSYGSNNLYAQLGSLAPAEQRVLRVTFQTSACEDSLKVFSNFGCNYPVTSQPEYSSPTLDSTMILFQSSEPNMLSAPVDGNKSIESLCDNQILEVEVRNSKDANLSNVEAWFVLPTATNYIAGSAEIAYPSDDYQIASTVTQVGDTIKINISDDVDLNTACGLYGASSLANLNLLQPANTFKFKIEVEFDECPITSKDEVVYNVKAENYCGKSVETSGVFNLLYTGDASNGNTYTLNAHGEDKLIIQSTPIGVSAPVIDSLYVLNLSGPTTSSNDSLSIVIENDTNVFIIDNFSVNAPWSAPAVSINNEGRIELKFEIPNGIVSGDSSLLELMYDYTPKEYIICSGAGAAPCPDIAHSSTFFGSVSVSCASTSLNCGTIATVSKGGSYVGRSVPCVPDADSDGIPDVLDLDDDNDGISDIVEACGPGATDYSCVGGSDPAEDDDNDGIANFEDPDYCTLNAAGVCENLDNDGDGIINSLDLDSDNDGITDIEEAGGEDTDGDGVLDLMADSNNNGIPDSVDVTVTMGIDNDGDGIDDSFQTGPDTDGDGIADAFDPDADGNGMDDVTETTPLNVDDTDGDGVPDFLDLDSDNDGIADIIEAGGVDPDGDGQVPVNPDGTLVTDADGDGLTDDPIVDTDGDGIADQPVDTDVTGGVAIPNTDTDGDGVPDFLDLDSDNDGIADIIEAGGVDPDGDGQVPVNPDGTLVTDADGDGLTDDPVVDTDGDGIADQPVDTDVTGGVAIPNTDTDGDGIPDALDLDSDNDGIADIIEAGGVDPDGDGQVPVNPDGTLVTDADGDGLTDDPVVDTDGDGIADQPVDTDVTGGVAIPNTDTDGDGIPDALDIDSDNDGITDIIEAGGIDADDDGHVDYPTPGDVSTMVDADGDGLTDGPVVDTDGDGIADQSVDTDVTGGVAIPNTDTDMDGLPDAIDIDADNDGIVDNIEAQSTDGYTAPVGMDSDGDGLDDAYDSDDETVVGIGSGTGTTIVLENTDNVDTPDYIDLDSDNDDQADLEEAWDMNGDDDLTGDLQPSGNDSDNDGLDDAFDVDGTSTINNGGANNGGQEPTDGTIANADNSSTIELDWREGDTDGDGIPDIVDLDDDNDGIPDTEEDLNLDGDNDPTTNPTDSDGDGIPNYLDLDSDNDGIADLTEAGGDDTDGDGRIDTMEDDDFDGIPNAVDVDYTMGTDNDSDGIDDAFQGGVDSDGDGIQDSDDTDADGDGLADVVDNIDSPDNGTVSEITTGTPLSNPDTDNDGIKDVLDLDSDNDGITDIIEAGGVDTDGDGEVDYATPGDATTMVDVDADGYADAVDPEDETTPVDEDGGTALPNEDTDGDGLANNIDLDSDNDGISDIIESGSEDSDGDGKVPTNADGTLVTDVDNDGLTDDAIVDTDNDGIADQPVDTDVIGGVAVDPTNTDGTGNPDYLDIDSDDDGITDIIEAGGIDADGDGHVDYSTPGDASTMTDADGDGLTDDPVVDTNNDGVADQPVDVDVTGGVAMPNTDTDMDGLSDAIDIDADNDGIVDNIEGQTTSGYTPPTGIDTDGDGLDDAYDGDDESTVGIGNGTGVSVDPTDTDLDGTSDWLDLDSDNDGEIDAIEGHDMNGDGVADITPDGQDSDNDGLDDAYDVDDSVINPTNGQVPTDFADVDIPGIGDMDWRELDNDGDGINDVVDLDDDNDGIPDYVEICGPGATDFTCASDPSLDDDGDGIINMNDPDNCTLNAHGICENLDTDNDGIPDVFDLDSDNDGIADIAEGGGEDTNGDGVVDNINPDGTLSDDANNDGISDDNELPNPPDFDNDGKPDFQDVDADNDGIYDIVEDGGVDSDNDGLVDSINPDGSLNDDPDGDGWTNTTPLDGQEDTDDDGNPDRIDLDSDNDGITDIIEDGGVDSDNDGMIDDFTDPDGDGADNDEMTDGLLDTDEDGIPDHEDLDSDNDGIADIEEAGGEDENNDGVIDNFTDSDGDGWDDIVGTSTPIDTDEDGNPDYTDLDSDGDGINDVIEGHPIEDLGNLDTDGDGMLDDLTDVDGNGWNDPSGTSTGNVPDTDEDGIPDYQDVDSDNDGVADDVEWDITNDGVGFDDCDDDGIPNYLDLDLCDISIPQGFSPNGDGVNDYFVIDGMEYYTDSKLVIINRWGNKVYESINYQNDWDGTNMFGVSIGGDELPIGTYFYIFEAERQDENGKDVEPTKGYIYLNR